MVRLIWKTVLTFLKKLKIELPYDPATPLLGIYPKEMKSVSQRDSCTHVSQKFVGSLHVLITASSTVVKIWKQSKCPSKDDRIKKT